MKYKVYCGLMDWSITVEADSDDEAVSKGKRELLDIMEISDTYYARAQPAEGKQKGKQK